MNDRFRLKWLPYKIWNRIRPKSRRVMNPPQEAVYQQLVSRDLGALGVADKFYPVGFAASYGLFYVILRAVQELPISNIVELGAGQTSLLFDALTRAQKLHAKVLTIENDPEWAARIAAAVQHKVVTVPLTESEKRDKGRSYRGYDLSGLGDIGPIDLLIIDGPPGGSLPARYSRLGALALLPQINPEQFIIIVDDAGRPGETQLSLRIQQELKRRGIAFGHLQINAQKGQDVIAGGAFIQAAYY